MRQPRPAASLDAVDGYLADEDRLSTVVEPKFRATGPILEAINDAGLSYVLVGRWVITAFNQRFSTKFDVHSETVRNSTFETP